LVENTSRPSRTSRFSGIGRFPSALSQQGAHIAPQSPTITHRRQSATVSQRGQKIAVPAEYFNKFLFIVRSMIGLLLWKKTYSEYIAEGVRVNCLFLRVIVVLCHAIKNNQKFISRFLEKGYPVWY
jgi:hypothetical protein